MSKDVKTPNPNILQRIRQSLTRFVDNIAPNIPEPEPTHIRNVRDFANQQIRPTQQVVTPKIVERPEPGNITPIPNVIDQVARPFREQRQELENIFAETPIQPIRAEPRPIRTTPHQPSPLAPHIQRAGEVIDTAQAGLAQGLRTLKHAKQDTYADFVDILPTPVRQIVDAKTLPTRFATDLIMSPETWTAAGQFGQAVLRDMPHVELKQNFKLEIWPQFERDLKRKEYLKMAACFSHGAKINDVKQFLDLSHDRILNFVSCAVLLQLGRFVDQNEVKFQEDTKQVESGQGHKLRSFIGKLRKKLGL